GGIGRESAGVDREGGVAGQFVDDGDARRERNRRDDRSGDDHVPGPDPFARRGDEAGQVGDDVGDAAGERLQVVGYLDGLAVPGHAGCQILDVASRPPLVSFAEDHAPVVHVAGESFFDVFGWGIDVGQLDGGGEGGNRCPDVVLGRVGGDVRADPHGDLGLGARVGPAGYVDGGAVAEERAVGHVTDEG